MLIEEQGQESQGPSVTQVDLTQLVLPVIRASEQEVGAHEGVERRPAALDRLLDWGREAHDGHGSTIVYFDKPARKRAGLALPGCRRPDLDCLRKLYAVLSSEGDVVTVGHRYRRIGRPS